MTGKNIGLEKTGIPEISDIDSVFPDDERLNKGPVAVIECFQRIPCNPCSTACRRNAIESFGDINDLPTINHERCNGCGLCVSRCPGLAIMVVDMTYDNDRALLRLPYEFTPLPEEGSYVTALDRAGKQVGTALVVKVQNTPALDKTAVVSIAVSKDLVRTVRNFQIKPNYNAESAEISHDEAEAPILCRCNDLDIDYIRDLMHKGFTSIDEIKRVSRLGMGPCQGRNCIPLVLGELSRFLKKPVTELNPGTYRPVVRSVSLGAVAELDEGASDKHE